MYLAFHYQTETQVLNGAFLFVSLRSSDMIQSNLFQAYLFFFRALKELVKLQENQNSVTPTGNEIHFGIL